MGNYSGRWGLKRDLDGTFPNLKVTNSILPAGLCMSLSELLSALDCCACSVPFMAWEGTQVAQGGGVIFELSGPPCKGLLRVVV